MVPTEEEEEEEEEPPKLQQMQQAGRDSQSIISISTHTVLYGYNLNTILT